MIVSGKLNPRIAADVTHHRNNSEKFNPFAAMKM